MNRRTLTLPLAIVVLLLLACAPPPRPRPVDVMNSATISAPFEAVWTALVEHLASRQIQIKTLTRDSGFLDTEFMALPTDIVADYAWTGGNLPSLLHDMGRIKANIFVKGISDRETSVTINCLVQVHRSTEGGSYSDALSTGRFEGEILRALESVASP